jgi:hypothetical protein
VFLSRTAVRDSRCERPRGGRIPNESLTGNVAVKQDIPASRQPLHKDVDPAPSASTCPYKPDDKMSRVEEDSVKYLIMIQSNPQSRAAWETWTTEQQMEFGRAHYTLSDELAAAGLLVASEGLADPALSTHVQVRDGQTLTTDGPFAESKEYLAGFYLVDVERLEDAVEIAARMPDAEVTSVEIRPVFDPRGLEL